MPEPDDQELHDADVAEYLANAPTLPTELRAAADEAEAAMAQRAEAARKLADAIDTGPSVADLVDQLDAAEAKALRTDTTDQAPDPDSPEQAAQAAAQLGNMPPGCLALLGPEVGSQVTHQVLPDGTPMIVLRIEHAAGSTIVGLSTGHAMTLRNNLDEQLRKAKLAVRGPGNGKLIVPGTQLPPPGQLRAPGQ